MQYISDDSMLNAVLSLLTIIMPYLEKNKPKDNIILDKFLEPDNETFFKEKVLYLINRGSIYRLDKAMETAAILLTNEKCAETFFNENEIDLMVDVALRELNKPNSVNTRVAVIKTLVICLNNKSYCRLFENRVAESQECVDLQILHEDHDYPYAPKERKQLNRLNCVLQRIREEIEAEHE